MDLKNKTALVTGSSRGIGSAVAYELALQGCTVIVHGSRESEALNKSFERVRSISPESIMVPADLSQPAEIESLFSKIEKNFNRLDILVNNAAVQKPAPVLDILQSDWDTILSINLRAPFLCSGQAGRMMRRDGKGGKIINISSVHAFDPRRNFAHYSASKGALEMLTKSLALELAEYNIQVNSVVAGAIATELTQLDRQSRLISAIPAGRIGTTDEIARLVSFLSSNLCDYMTGAHITVDGGLTLGFCASRPDL